MKADEILRLREEIELGLPQFIGSERWFRHWSRQLVYTEGDQFLAERTGAYWVIDLVASWNSHEVIRNEAFVVWRLVVLEDRTALVTVGDGDGRELTRQAIPWTNFPLDEVSFYLTNGTLLLPSEY